MIEVEGPNGLVVEFPDGTDDKTIDRVMREAVSGKQAGPGLATDMIKSAGSGLAGGAAALVGLPGTVAELGARGIDAATQYIAPKFGIQPQPRPKETMTGVSLPDIPTVTKAMEDNLTGPLYQPKTTAGKFVRTAAEFIPGAVLAPGGMAANAIRFGVVPGIASEAAGQATEGTSIEPVARVAGALTGGVAGAMVGRPGRTSQIIRSQMPEGVTPQMVDQAEALIVDAAQQGIALSWPEALSQTAGRPILTNTMRHLEASPSSEARMAEFFGQRPQQIDNAAGQVFDRVTPAAPNPSEIGPLVGEATEGIVTDVRGAINTASDPFYQQAANVRLTPQEMARVRALPGFDEARRAIRGDPQLARYVAGLPDDSVGFLNEVKKYLDTAAENAAGPVNPQRNQQRSAGYGSDARIARQIGIDASPEYEAALTIQSQLREQYLDPLMRGPLGKLADKDKTTRDAINALFPNNPLPNSAQEIETTVRALANRNQYAARNLVRAHLESTFNESTRALQTGANQAGGAKFRVKLVGNPQQAANLEAAVRALPNGDQVWTGMQRFLDVLEATGTRQNIGSKTAYNAEALKEMSASGAIAETGKAVTNPFSGLKFLAEKYERWQLGQNLDQLAAVFTDPRAGNLLRSIARMPANSSAAARAAWRIAQLSESATGPRSAKPVEKSGKKP